MVNADEFVHLIFCIGLLSADRQACAAAAFHKSGLSDGFFVHLLPII